MRGGQGALAGISAIHGPQNLARRVDDERGEEEERRRVANEMLDASTPGSLGALGLRKATGTTPWINEREALLHPHTTSPEFGTAGLPPAGGRDPSVSPMMLPATEISETVGGTWGEWPVPSVGLERFIQEWEGFIDGLIKEWKTLNIVSALLLRYDALFLPYLSLLL